MRCKINGCSTYKHSTAAIIVSVLAVKYSYSTQNFSLFGLFFCHSLWSMKMCMHLMIIHHLFVGMCYFVLFFFVCFKFRRSVEHCIKMVLVLIYSIKLPLDSLFCIFFAYKLTHNTKHKNEMLFSSSTKLFPIVPFYSFAALNSLWCNKTQ